MKDYGTVRPGSTLYFYAASYAASTGASSAMTGLATSDIKVYKAGSTTERASASGYTLLDTDGLDVDSITGLNGFSIDLADNTTAGFWTAGSDYTVVVSTVTVDSQTVSYIAGTFRIGYPDAILNTTIATLSTQTSFTLTAGPAEDDALNGCVVCIHDAASAVQLGFGFIIDYTGSTKTATLAAGTTFTAAAGDNISVMPKNVRSIDAFGYPEVTATYLGGTGGISVVSEIYGIGAKMPGLVLKNGAAGPTGNTTTTIHIDDAGYTDDDELNNHLISIYNEADGTWHSRWIEDYVASTSLATVATLPFTPATDDSTYCIMSIRRDTMTESLAEIGQGTPPATTDLETMIRYLYKAWRNKKTQTATQYSLFADDASTVDHKATISSDGTTTTIGEVATGP